MPDQCRVSAVLLMMAALMGCAGPRLQPGLPGDRVPVLHATSAMMSDGYVLPLSVWKPEGDIRAVVLALHGMNDYRHAFAGVGKTMGLSLALTHSLEGTREAYRSILSVLVYNYRNYGTKLIEANSY